MASPRGPPAASWQGPPGAFLCVPRRAPVPSNQFLVKARDLLMVLPRVTGAAWGGPGGLSWGSWWGARGDACTRCCCHLTALGEVAFCDSAVFIPAPGPAQHGFPWKTSIQNKGRRSYSRSDSATTGSFGG